MNKRTKRILVILSTAGSVAVIALIVLVLHNALIAHHNRDMQLAWKAYTASRDLRRHLGPCTEPEDAGHLVRFRSSDLTTQVIAERAYPMSEAYGFKNGQGDIVIPARFYWTSETFKYGLAVATASGSSSSESTGYIDALGEWVLPPMYTGAYDFSCELGRVYVHRDNKRLYGYVDATGAVVHETTLDFATDFHCEFALVGHERCFSELVASNYYLREIAIAIGSERSFVYHVIDRAGRRIPLAEISKSINTN